MNLLQPDELFACLAGHDVRYVLIGGLAGVLHGSPLPTVDADICPARDRENLMRLARAFDDVDARLRTPDTPGGVPFPLDADFLERLEMLNLTTRLGDLDVSFTPAGTTGYGDLVQNAESISIRGIAVPVASLDDVIRSKTAANRPKDQRALPMLHQLRDEIRRRRGGD